MEKGCGQSFDGLRAANQWILTGCHVLPFSRIVAVRMPALNGAARRPEIVPVLSFQAKKGIWHILADEARMVGIMD